MTEIRMLKYKGKLIPSHFWFSRELDDFYIHQYFTQGSVDKKDLSVTVLEEKRR